MSKVPVINMDSSKAAELEMPGWIESTPYNPILVKDAVVYHQAKMRQGTHATKTRSQVRGSTKKLFRQKGTGSARAGDSKATQRRGGGIPHGPKPRSHAISLNKKVRKAALRSAIAEKLRQERLLVVDKIEPATHKTKDFAKWLDGLNAPEALIVTAETSENLILASTNLPSVAVIHFGQLNVYNLLVFEKAIFSREALAALEKRLAV